MARLLFTVEAAFTIGGYGLGLCPGVRLEDYRTMKSGDEIELRLPNGSSLCVTVKQLVDPATIIHAGQPPAERTSFVILPEEFRPEDVPVGTEVWLPDPLSTEHPNPPQDHQEMQP